MMTKKQLKQRLMDIASGAGMSWIENDEYWDCLTPESLSRFIEGMVMRLKIPRDSYLVHFVNLDRYEDIDTLVDFMHDSADLGKAD